jgi:hypothetical protein
MRARLLGRRGAHASGSTIEASLVVTGEADAHHAYGKRIYERSTP